MPVKNAERKIIGESHRISEKRGNGELRRQVWVDSHEKVTRYNLAYINHRLYPEDNGRVVGYDNTHGQHHRHYFGQVEPIDFVNFAEIESRFEQEWLAMEQRGAEMKEIIIETATEKDFFESGRRLAHLADSGERLPEQRVISFEDPADLLRLLTGARLALFRAIKEKPDSITDISWRLHRDRSAVKRDVDELARFGLVEIESKVLPGHGRMKEVRAVAGQFRLEARLA